MKKKKLLIYTILVILALLIPGHQNIELSLKSGDRFFLYTDSIIEAANAAGTLFGWSRFKEFITSHASLSVGNCADALIQHISRQHWG